MADTETVSLNLDGSFAPNAAADAAAAEKLSAAFDRLGAASQKVKNPAGNDAGRMSAVTAELEQQAALEAKIATFDAQRVRNVAALEAKYKAMKDAALGVKPAANDNGKGLVSFNENAGGTSILGGAVALGGSAGLAFQAGEKILSAAYELGKSAVEVAAAGVKLSIEESSKRELQDKVFKTLGGDFDATIHLAATYGIDEAKAVSEVKGLLNAGFSQHAIELDVKVAAAIDLVKGDGKGAAFLEHLEKLQLEPKVTTKDIKSLAELGLDTKKVYENLAKSMGVSVAEAEAKVKAGAVDTEKVLSAVEKTGEEQFGKLGDSLANSVPALLGRVKADFAHLFDTVDLGPVKDLLKNVAEAFEGPSGGALKASVTELFGAINHAFLDQFKGEEGKAKIEAFMRGAVASIHELSGAVTEAKPLIEALTSAAGDEAVGGLSLLATAVHDAVIVVTFLSDAFNVAAQVVGFFLAPVYDAIAALDALTGSTTGAGNAIGVGLDQGLADGMQGGASLAAAEAMAQGVLATVKGVFEQHSPSAAFGRIGAANDVGMAQTMAEGDASEKAGAQMARKALDAASGENEGGGGAAGGRRGSSAGAPTGGDTYIFQITPAPGTTDAQSDEISEKSYRKFQEHQRRDARERAA